MSANKSSSRPQREQRSQWKRNDEDEASEENFRSTENVQQPRYEFQLDIDIRKSRTKPIRRGYGKSLYEAEWINQDGPPIVILQIDGAKPTKDASFYVQLSCHPHIIRTYGLIRTYPNSTMLLQEYPPQGNLSELLRAKEFAPNERVLCQIFDQLCDAMIFLASKNIIHGDLACRNVLVFQMNPVNPKKNLVKLTDFGLTTVSQLYSVVHTQTLTTMTTIPTRYAPPELLTNLHKLDYSEKSDIYSMGVLMWEACSVGKLPYSDIDDSEEIRQLKLKDNKLSKPSLCSDNLWNIINQCCQLQPRNRPYFRSLKQSISSLQSQPMDRSETEIIPNDNIDHTVISLQLNKNADYRYATSEDDREQENSADLTEFRNGKYYSGEESVDSAEIARVPNGTSSCPFCQDCLPSQMDLHDHLIQCGTKTDQCPNCRQFIQRAIFAYHYENNCADINQTEISSRNISPSNFDENTELNTSNIQNSSELFQCEFCQNYCLRNECEVHKKYCLRNPHNENNTFQKRSTLSLHHLTSTRVDRPHSSGKSSVIPCEYCENQYCPEELRTHQRKCGKTCNQASSRSKSNGKGSSALLNDDEDERALLEDEGSDCPVLDPKLRPVDEQTEEKKSEERGCCCCS